MNEERDERDPLDEIAEEFLERARRGERLDISEFAARVPGQAREARELLSALVIVEGLKPRPDDTAASVDRELLLASIPRSERLGDFQVVREIGRGGMGVVYEARQISLGRRVALKVLSPAVARTSRQIQRFLREARSAAQLHHTNIVPVFGVGDQDGLYYYAMQYINGQGLDRVLDEVKRQKFGLSNGAVIASTTRSVARGASTTVLNGAGPRLAVAPLPSMPSDSLDLPPSATPFGGLSSESGGQYAEGVARIGEQVARALDYAHKQGTLHRDIKPSNLLLDQKGNVWIADFGLAKAVEDDDLTQTGDLVGTIRYMAPEQFRGSSDARSDIHALGLTLYEMMALRPAFEAPGRERLIAQVSEKDPPRLRLHCPNVPRDLETIIHKAIERNPDHRYASAGAMAEDLRRFLEHRPIGARRVGSTERLTRWARRNPGLATLGTAVAGLLALTVAVIAVADLRLRDEHAAALRNLHRAERAEADAVGKLLQSSLTQSRAGRRGGLEGRRLEGLRVIASAVPLDTTGARLAEMRDEAIACLALTDIQRARYWPEALGNGYLGLDFDPAFRFVARGQPGGSILLDDMVNTGRTEELIGSTSRPVMLRFSPDGRFLAAKHEEGQHVELVMWDLSTREVAWKLSDVLSSNALDFMPDGMQVVVGRRDGSIAFHDTSTGRERRTLDPGVVPKVIRCDAQGARLAVVSTDSDTTVQVREIETGAITAEWTEPARASAVAWHPRGRWLAAGGLNGAIHLLDTSEPGRPPRVLDGHDGQCVALEFHPKRSMLASASWDGTFRLWDTLSNRPILQAQIKDARPLRFSGDGRFVGPGHDGASSWVWQLVDGQECRELAVTDGHAVGSWSVGYLGDPGVVVTAGAPGVSLNPLDRAGGSAVIPIRDARTVSIAPDSSFLITSGSLGLLKWPISRGGVESVRVGPPIALKSFEGLTPERACLSANGRVLAVVVDEELGRVVVLDLEADREISRIAGHPNLERVAISPDGSWIATGTWKGAGVRVWETASGKLARELPVRGSAEVQFSPAGDLLVVGSGEAYELWDTSTWTKRFSFGRSFAEGLPGPLAFRPDGGLIALLSTRSSVQLVDPKSGKVVSTLEAPEPRHVTDLAFTSDGERLVVVSNTDPPLIWDLFRVRAELAKIGLDWNETRPRFDPSKLETRHVSLEIEPAAWHGPFQAAQRHLMEGRFEAAAAEYQAAIELGVPDLDAYSRLALARLILKDQPGYRAACRGLLDRFRNSEPALKIANNVAWTCALGPDALDDYATVLALARESVAGRPVLNRLNTLGAVYFRSGAYRDAIDQLHRSIAAHGAGGTPYDAIILAMSHHRLGESDKAREWLARAQRPAPIAMRKPDVEGPSSWLPRLELQLLREEAERLILGESAQ